MDVLVNRYRRLVESAAFPFVRSLAKKIQWQSRGISIEGPRGVGKSTLMLQYIRQHLPLEQSLYVTLDDLYFRKNSLVETTNEFYRLGGRYLFIDEAHKYAGWQTEVKNIYDFHPDLQIVVSGSSILALQQSPADLSRRLARYSLPVLSFREYLALTQGVEWPAHTLPDLLEKHEQIAADIVARHAPVLALYKHYQSVGQFPFFLTSEADYPTRISQLINLIIDYDLPEARPLEKTSLGKLKTLLYIISTAAPFKPNIQKLAAALATNRNQVLDMLDMLDKAQLIRLLRSSARGVSLLNKPEKIYLHNTNFIHALAEDKPNSGNLRETLFLTHTRDAGLPVTHSSQTDFTVSSKYHFEIGGKGKAMKQLTGLSHAFVVPDDIEIGYRQKIPLWLFGFLY